MSGLVRSEAARLLRTRLRTSNPCRPERSFLGSRHGCFEIGALLLKVIRRNFGPSLDNHYPSTFAEIRLAHRPWVSQLELNSISVGSNSVHNYPQGDTEQSRDDRTPNTCISNSTMVHLWQYLPNRFRHHNLSHLTPELCIWICIKYPSCRHVLACA